LEIQPDLHFMMDQTIVFEILQKKNH